jgi:hypothetical protein
MGPAPGTTRLSELLDGIRAEFESQARASGEYEHSSEFPGLRERRSMMCCLMGPVMIATATDVMGSFADV